MPALYPEVEHREANGSVHFSIRECLVHMARLHQREPVPWGGDSLAECEPHQEYQEQYQFEFDTATQHQKRDEQDHDVHSQPR